MGTLHSMPKSQGTTRPWHLRQLIIRPLVDATQRVMVAGQESPVRECIVLVTLAGFLHAGTAAKGKDWPMLGRDATRNAVSSEKNPPTSWSYELDRQGNVSKTSANVKWVARLGGVSFCTPVISDGLAWVGSNNDNPRDPSFQADASVLMCFRESDGKFLWQFIVGPRKAKVFDWEQTALNCSPVIQGNRLWITTSSAEVICLDIGPLIRGDGLPVVLWRVDMIKEFDIAPHGMGMGYGGARSVSTPFNDYIYVITGNGVDWGHVNIPVPRAPSLVALDKRTGRLIWEDNAPGKDIFHIQNSTPLVVEINGRGRVIAGLGDGKLRSYDANTGKEIWTFDCNPPEYRTKKYGLADGPSEIIATPVFHKGRVYIAIGHDREHGEGSGNLVCVDAATGRAIWQSQKVHRSMSQVVVAHDRLYTADLSGFVYCFDADSGRLRWNFDARAPIMGSPLLVDNRLYIGDEDGDLMAFDLREIEHLLTNTKPPLIFDTEKLFYSDAGGARKDLEKDAAARLVRVSAMNYWIGASPVFANGLLYVNAQTHLVAIASTPVASSTLPSPGHKVPNTTFVPTPQDVVEKMLEVAETTRTDLVYDLGSGDGRIVITAAKKYGCKAVGYELDPKLVDLSVERIRKERVDHLVHIEERDLFSANLGQVDVVTVFLPGYLMAKLAPQFRQLKPGARIVSYEFQIPGVEPDKVVHFTSKSDKTVHTINVWVAPLRTK